MAALDEETKAKIIDARVQDRMAQARLQALELAVRTHGPTFDSDSVRATAQAYLDFMLGTPQPVASTLPPHQQRVMNEHYDLNDKVEKLAAFFGTQVFDDLDGAEKNRLREQIKIMVNYRNILAQRIAAF